MPKSIRKSHKARKPRSPLCAICHRPMYLWGEFTLNGRVHRQYICGCQARVA